MSKRLATTPVTRVSTSQLNKLTCHLKQLTRVDSTWKTCGLTRVLPTDAHPQQSYCYGSRHNHVGGCRSPRLSSKNALNVHVKKGKCMKPAVSWARGVWVIAWLSHQMDERTDSRWRCVVAITSCLAAELYKHVSEYVCEAGIGEFKGSDNSWVKIFATGTVSQVDKGVPSLENFQENHVVILGNVAIGKQLPIVSDPAFQRPIY